MVTDSTYPEGKSKKTEIPDKIKCDTCGRELKTSSEWLSTAGGFICEICYKNLLYPNTKINLNH
jgi:hypothetical protein